MTTPTRLTISSLAMLKMQRAIHIVKGDEVGGMIEFSPDMSKGLIVKDIYFPKQSISGATVQFDDEAMAEYAEHMVIDRKLDPILWRTGWWHHHPFQSSVPSGVDWSTTNEKFGPKLCPHFSVMLITSKKDTSCNLRLTTGPLSINTELEVDWDYYGLPAFPGFEKFDDNLISLCKKQTYEVESNWFSKAETRKRSDRFRHFDGLMVDVTDGTYYDQKTSTWRKVNGWTPENASTFFGNKKEIEITRFAEENDTTSPIPNTSYNPDIPLLTSTLTTPPPPAPNKAFNLNMHSPATVEDMVHLAHKLHQVIPSATPEWAIQLYHIYDRLKKDDKEVVSQVVEQLDRDLVPIAHTLGRFVAAYKLRNSPKKWAALDDRDKKVANQIFVETAEADDARRSKIERTKYDLTNTPTTRPANVETPSLKLVTS